ncbi:T9SS type B sorting domain-containing protein [Aquimarina sp. 2201CG14-23]|uniref:T9SS type B sorting domain-containing protein n=1 Tax=Aquimarina mycalae TaxID=3040073 RepID=UPI002477E717|nr:choice-of-anchor L domain-containing protein [Aquimarina sp. 2201CG14-23]MDH7444017.1 choice-of-anchor L domain-containing protein [Aquimarina sp. 2201CG14-23]
MNKNTLFFILFSAFTMPFFGQITVDDSSFTAQQLVEDVLIDSPCATVENISSFTGTAQGFNGIGYFESNGSGFEIERGVILSTGNASSASGPNGPTPLGEGDGTVWGGDADLANITSTPSLFNASYIQFEFVPTIDFISFDFLFASEEYTGAFPCSFSDVFAFILTDSSGNSVNLAVVPGTNPPVPIKVTTVHDGVDLNNNGIFTDVVNGTSECAPQNPTFFNRRIPANSPAPIDFNGYTQVLTASGNVIANERYTIKLVIADNQDGDFDSAVFLAAGSFNLGGDLGDDRTLAAGNPGCTGDSIILNATIGTSSTYTWMKDGLPLAAGDGTTLLAGGAQLEITQGGVYSVEIAIASGCTASDSVTVEFINSPDIIAPPINLTSCDDDDDGFNSFDLTVNSSLVLGGQDPMIFPITYHLTQNDAENYTGLAADPIITTPDNFVNTTAGQTIWLRIAESNQKCYKVSSFDLEVVRNPVANTLTDLEACDNDNDGSDVNGIIEFDLSVKRTEVLGAQNPADFTVLFYENQTAADAGNPGTELADLYTNVANTQTIFVRIENNTDRQCYETTTFRLVVNPLPVVSNVVSLLQCDDDTDGFSLFNLSEANSLISTNFTNETFTYYLTEQEAVLGNTSDQITNFTTYSNPIAINSVVYTRIESDKGCTRTSRIDLQVSATQIPSAFNLTYAICEADNPDDNSTDGIATFDFSDATDQILQLYPGGQNLSVSYYQNEADALSEENEILNINAYRNEASPFTQNLYVRVENGDDNTCLGLGEHISLFVNPFIPIGFEDEYTICLEGDGSVINLLPTATIDTGLDAVENTFQWYTGTTPTAGNEIPGATNADFSPTVPGEYTVLVTNVATGCLLSRSTRVIESYPPESITTELISGAFSDNATIQVNVVGNGEYEFRLDNGDWQSSNIFERVPRGEHIVYVRDFRMCRELEADVEFIVDYPRYFTPNGDSFHDTWGIVGNENVQITGILIFDRFGKLLKDLGSSGTWDGTFNGRLLPSNDYWFRVMYTEEGVNKQFNANFSLIR